ncbi:hypothetical protein [Bacteroides finegoldii]|uniref:hypothetical protein n=1 Tax=Bacteroides TaxID=816 RepID=UPI0034A06E81
MYHDRRYTEDKCQAYAPNTAHTVPCGHGYCLACIVPTTQILPFSYTRVYLINAAKIEILHLENNSFCTFVSLTDSNAIFPFSTHFSNTKQ